MGCGSSVYHIPDTGPGALLQNNPASIDFSKDVFDEHKWPVGTIPKVLWRITSITSLNVSGQKLKSVDQVTSLVNLELLDISANEIVDFPHDIQKLHDLKRLIAFGNKFVSLPKSIGKLKGLTELNLYNNRLEILPPDINKLTSLTSINFGSNPLKVLPSLAALRKLEAVRFQMCHIEHIEGSWETLTSLKDIIMNTNELARLPVLPPSVVALDVVGNNLSELADSLKLCNGLKELKVNNNHICSIPIAVLKPSLQSIGFAGNFNISAIPPEIKRCTELTTLVLDRNRLTKLPNFLLDMPYLRRLNVQKNPLDMDDPETKDVFGKLKHRLRSRDEHGRKGYFKV